MTRGHFKIILVIEVYPMVTQIGVVYWVYQINE